MKPKARLPIIVLLGLLILGGLFVLQGRSLLTNDSSQALPVVKINNVSIEVELAKTPEQQARGLSGRTSLNENQGMLFLYDEPGTYSFWMKDMNFPIDIIWIGNDEKIVDISKDVPPESFLKTFQPQKPVQYVLEVNAGFADKNNIAIGDAVELGDIFMGRKFTELVFAEDSKNDEVIVLNRDGRVVKRIKVGEEPHDVAVSPDGKVVVTGNQGDGTASIIDVETLSVQNTIKTDKGAHGVVFSPDGKFLFVANSKKDTLSIIETENFSQQTKVKVGQFPEYVGVTKDGSKVFTTNLGNGGSMTVLENRGFQSKVIDEIQSGIDPRGWAISPDGTKIVITNLGSNSAYLFDSNTFEEISHFDTGAISEFATFLDDTVVWVTNIGAHYISVIDLVQKKVIEQIEVGETPHGIAFSNDKLIAFVPLYKPGEMVIIDVKERKIINRVKIGEELHNAVVVQTKF